MTALGLRIGWLTLTALLVLVFFPPAASAFSVVKRDCYFWMALLVWILWALQRIAARDLASGLRRATLLLPVAPLVVLGCVQALLGATTQEISPLLDLACGSALLMVLLAETDARRRAQLGLILTGTVGLAAAYAIADHTWGPFITWDLVFAGAAPGSTFGNPLFLADAIILVLPYAGLKWLGARGWRRLCWGTLAIVLFHALLLAQGRGAWVGAAAACGLLLVLLSRHHSGLLRRNHPWLALAAAVIVLDVAVLSMPNPLNPHRISVIKHAATLHDPYRQGTEGRFLLWEATALMARQRPLLGWGPGQLHAHFTEFQGRLLAEPRYRHLDYRMTYHSHNDLLQLMAERGVAGLGLLVWILAVWFKGMGTLAAESWPRYALRAGMLCGMAAWLVGGLFNSPLHLPPTAQLFWIVLALGWLVPGDKVENLKPRKESPAMFFAGYVLLLFMLRPFARDLLSETYLQSGAFEYGRGNYRLALSLKARAWQLALEDRRHQFYLGNVLVRLGDFEQAEEAYESDLKRNPAFASSWCNLGMVKLALGKPREALHVLDRARELAPFDPEVHAQLAWAFVSVGKVSQARTHWRLALDCGYRGPKVKEFEMILEDPVVTGVTKNQAGID